jgi:hypothetical protein
MFLMHVPATAVPEPTTVALFSIALFSFGAASRRRVRLRRYQFKRASGVTRIVCAAAAALAAVTLTSSSASAAYVSVHGGPTFTPGLGGFKDGGTADVNDAGTAVGIAYKYNGSGVELGSHAVRWDSSGAPAIELGRGGARDINEAGIAVGSVVGLDASYVAVRWDASGAATELESLGSNSAAGAVNDAGTAVGSSWKHNSSGAYRGIRAVRWDASGNAATELDNLGPNGGFAFNYAVAINAAGAAVGQADIDFGIGTDEYYGTRAVRWDAASTEVTELGNLGTDPSGITYGIAYDINADGTAIGWANMYDVWEYLGSRAVRWDASGTAATELGNLGTDANSITESSAVAINDAGTTVGYANLYDGLGESLGRRAVRWDASGTVATELGNLGAGDGITETDVFAISDAGVAVGYADDYDDSGTNLGERAVYWGLDAVAVDLNTLIDPVSGWTLNRATAISNTGWIGGSGVFDPDGAGGQEAYGRLFLIQIPVPSDLPGDYSGNGTVGPEDYGLWKANFGSTTNLDADGNDDGRVNAADYTIWRNNLGGTLGFGSGAAGYPLGASVAPLSPAVPEPATLALAAVGLVSVIASLRRRSPHSGRRAPPAEGGRF